MVWSIWVNFIACVLRLYHFMVFGGDGVGNPGALVASNVLAALSEILLVLHLILVAKGWTIVRRKVRQE